ncbi:VOC family protein [Hymenobacter sp.]|uniref:VOC family protein n=1 Tax=Hymenobacter sp. TaxID=1898978 RepID=UPI00286CD482|nr:VOC family protein [Hymenobacter sp.]
MAPQLSAVVIHVLNIWQTCEWYRQVFGFVAAISPDAASAHFQVAGQSLIFVAHDAQEETFGPHRPNSFLADPPAFHLDITTTDVQSLFDHALSHGAVPVLHPALNAQGQVVAGLRDLNGILVQLIQFLPTNIQNKV